MGEVTEREKPFIAAVRELMAGFHSPFVPGLPRFTGGAVGYMLLLDAADRVKRGGTGVVVDWNRAAVAARNHQIVLAGGLTPLNVEEAIRSVRPVGVDVASGVEASPGIKDFAKVSAFLANARRAFAAL